MEDEDDRIACFELALDGWLALTKSLNDTTAPTMLQLGCIQAIFDAFVAKQLSDAATDDDSDEECEGELAARDQLLMTIGTIAGGCMEHSLRVLQQPFMTAFAQIQAGAADAVVLESLHSLLLLFGHVLVNTNEALDNEITHSITPAAATIVETVRASLFASPSEKQSCAGGTDVERSVWVCRGRESSVAERQLEGELSKSKADRGAPLALRNSGQDISHRPDFDVREPEVVTADVSRASHISCWSAVCALPR